MTCCIPKCNKLNKDISLHLFPSPTREPERHRAWLKKINCEKLFSKEPMIVYKQYRVCRLHFSKDCFNGGCKRLLNSAIPSLNLLNNQKNAAKFQLYEKKMIKLMRENSSITIGDDTFDLISVEETSHNSMIELPPAVSDDDSQLTITEIQDQEIIETDSLIKKESHLEEDEEFEIMEVIEELEGIYEDVPLKLKPVVQAKKPLTEEQFSEYRSEFYKCPKNRLAQNVCSRIDPFDAALSREKLEKTQHVFTYKIETEGKPITNQKNSGRCWNFATLNVIRVPFIKQYNLEEFEFSQAYLFYWDKIERSYYFLNNVVDVAKRGEAVDGRLMAFLLNDPTCDGGQWDMIVNLINKHGLMPKKSFPESFSCESSSRMDAILKSKLREYAKVLRDLISTKASDADVQSKMNQQMKEIYNVVGICLGIPAKTFTWEYYDKSKKFQSIGPLTPKEFYERHVKPVFNVDDKVCLVTDPRPSNEYGKSYTVDCLGNVIGGRPVLYNNQPVELLMELVTKSLKNGEPIWFGCEVSKRFATKQGIEDLEIQDFKLVFGVDIQVTMSKGDRLLYGESLMTHAMAFTGVSVDKSGEPTKFRVENSWGEDRGEKGYLVMTADWFKEFVFEVVIDKSLVPADVMKVFDIKPVVLPAWDPMGNLAK